MCRLLTLSILSLLCQIGSTAADDAKKLSPKEKVLAQLQGRWELQWMEREEKRQESDGTAVVTIKGDRWMFGKREIGVIEIDPSTNPMVIDIRVKKDLAEADKGQTLEGIFKLDGDRLTICFSRSRGEAGKERPTAFSTKGNARMVLQEFKRVKP
ncbi:MAG TPA: TIGR03067 domain-containing protein [Urbifossiella sp.]|nr:TIGR03067 domain-containing protein [Urbifossiella sp.]